MKKGLEEVGESSCGTCGCWAVRGEDCELLVESAPGGGGGRCREQLQAVVTQWGVAVMQEKSINSRDRKNRTALHLACVSGQSSVWLSLSSGIGSGCFVTRKARQLSSRLYNARMMDAHCLAGTWCDPNLEDDSQNTALHTSSWLRIRQLQHSCSLNANLEAINEKVQHPRFAKPVQAWQEPMINNELFEDCPSSEAKDGVLKPGTSTSFEDNNSDNKNEDVVTTFPQPLTEIPGFSRPAFPAPEPLTSSAVLAVTEVGGNKQFSSVPLRKEEESNWKEQLDEYEDGQGPTEEWERGREQGAFRGDPSDWDSTSLSPNNAAGQRAQHLKVDKCPLVSQSVTTDQSAPTELRQTAPVDKDQMNIGAVSLSENAALRGLCESQLPENSSSKEADLDFQRAAEEEQERRDGSENNLSQVEVEENRNKSSELKGSETMCDGNCYKGLTQQRKRGKTDDQQFPALQKGNSDRDSCPEDSAHLAKELSADLQENSGNNGTEGPVFSSGHDLKELTDEQGPDYHAEVFRTCSEVMMMIQNHPVPVIAMVNGLATAAGCQLVASCDIAVASDKSSFATPGVNIGLFCSTPGVALGRAVPRKVALEMLFTGEAMSAQEALLHGLLSRVVPEERLEEETMRIARKVASLSRPVVSLGKAAFYRQLAQDLRTAYHLASQTMVDNLGLPDGQEGIKAFLQKRKPVWSHRVASSEDPGP
ncbi:Enoyl-CoA hydratase domain-containing protein 3; mitochondrial [Camelus dromedarius]|uniref:Enoyl-CoA hydratase domain-containing protein 3, mitochondrial n=1 Tax=Camelus dromedarius TaxID=9838 RepID=A0A5N4C6V6_CAMDR|nr:Enoyl-CoA hydratase domain-containing protein 3; mitochondrial [Camelus dromedarius]